MATPSLPGVSYKALDDPANLPGNTSSSPSSQDAFHSDNSGLFQSSGPRNPSQYNADLATINKQYQDLQQTTLQPADTSKKDEPLWKQVLSSAPVKAIATLAKYTSGNEWARKLPGVSAVEDYVPGVRQALDVATNPLTYATGGVGGAAAAAAGAGLGAWAFSPNKRGLDLPMPFVPDQYKEGVGSLLGGLAGAKVGSMLQAGQAADAAANAEANLSRMEGGTLQQGDVMHTADGMNFTPRRPTFDTPDQPLDWNTVSVKDPNLFEYSPTDKSWALKQGIQEGIDNVAGQRVAASGQVMDMPYSQAVQGNPAFDVLQEGVKNGLQGVRQNIGETVQGAKQAIQGATPGFRTVARTAATMPGQMALGMVKPFISPNALKAEAVLGAGGFAASKMGLGGETPQALQGQQPQGGKGFFGKVFDAVGSIVEPAITPYINGVNAVYDHLPKPVQDDISTGVHTYQAAVNKFITPVTTKIDEASRAVTGHTIDPLVYALLPDKYANPITDAIDFAGSLAPYVALEYVTMGAATGALPGLTEPLIGARVAAAITTAQTAAFGAQGLAGATSSWEAYKQGNLTTGQFLASMGMDVGMVAGMAKMGEHVGETVHAVDEAHQVQALNQALKNDPQLARQMMLDGAENKVNLMFPGLDAEKHQQAVESYKEAINKAFDGLNQESPANPEQTPQERVAAAGQAVGPQITERQQTPVDVRNDQHRLEAPGGGFIEWRGTHIMDVNAGEVQGQGIGTALLQEAVQRIQAAHPGEPITADLNTEGGARVMARAGAHFTDFRDNPIDIQQAIELANANQGPKAVIEPQAEGAIAEAAQQTGPERFSAETKAIKNQPLSETDQPLGNMTPEQAAALFSRNRVSNAGTAVEAPQDVIDRHPEFAQSIIEQTTQNGGGMFNVDTGKPMVSQAAGGDTPGVTVGVFPERGIIIPADQATPEVVQQWIAANKDVLGNGRYVGTWLHNGELHLEVSQIETPEDAVRLAKAGNQKALYDNTSGNDIPVPGVSDKAVEQKQTAARQRGAKLLGQEFVNPDIEKSKEIQWIDRQQVFPATDRPGDMTGMTQGEGRDIGKKTKNGQITGYPEGVKTQRDVNKMRANIEQMALAGAQYRWWYEESSHDIIKAMYGVDLGDPHSPDYTQRVAEFVKSRSGDVADADRFAQMLSILSQSRPVPVNSTYATRTWLQKITGTDLHNINFPEQYAKLEQAFRGEEWGNLKTSRFYMALLKNINPEKYAEIASGESTIDIHMMRALGYKAKNPNGAQYIAAAREIERLAQKLGWSGDQTQAAIWIVQKAKTDKVSLEEAAFHFGDGLQQSVATIVAHPGNNRKINIPADAPPEQVAEYTQRMQDIIDGKISEATGYPMPANFASEGSTGHTAVAPQGPGGATDNPHIEQYTRNALNGITAYISKLTGANDVGWIAALETNKKFNFAHNLMAVDAGRPLTEAEAGAIKQALAADGIDAHVEVTPGGAWIRNNSESYNLGELGQEIIRSSPQPERVGMERPTRLPPSTGYEKVPDEEFKYVRRTDKATEKALKAETDKFIETADKAVQTSLPDEINAKLYTTYSDSGKVDSNGENLDTAIRDSGIPQAAWLRLDTSLEPAVDALNREFSDKYGWQLTGDTGTAAEAPTQGNERVAAAGSFRSSDFNHLLEPTPSEENLFSNSEMDNLLYDRLNQMSKQELLDYGRQLQKEVANDPYVRAELEQVQQRVARYMKQEAEDKVRFGAEPQAEPQTNVDQLKQQVGALRLNNNDLMDAYEQALHDENRNPAEPAFRQQRQALEDELRRRNLYNPNGWSERLRIREQRKGNAEKFANTAKDLGFDPQTGLPEPEYDMRGNIQSDYWQEVAKTANLMTNNQLYEAFSSVGQRVNDFWDKRNANELTTADNQEYEKLATQFDELNREINHREGGASNELMPLDAERPGGRPQPVPGEPTPAVPEKAHAAGEDQQTASQLSDLSNQYAEMDKELETYPPMERRTELYDKREELRRQIEDVQTQRGEAGLPRIWMPQLTELPKDMQPRESTKLIQNATIFDPHSQTYYGNGRYAQHEWIIKGLGELAQGYWEGLGNLYKEGYVRLEAIPEKGRDNYNGYDHIEMAAGSKDAMEPVIRNLVDVQHLPLNTPLYWDIRGEGVRDGGLDTLGDFYKPAAAEPTQIIPHGATWMQPDGEIIGQGGRTHIGIMEGRGDGRDIPELIDAGYVRIVNRPDNIAIQAKTRADMERVLKMLPASDAQKTVYYDLVGNTKAGNYDMTFNGMKKEMEGSKNAGSGGTLGYASKGESGISTVEDLLPKEEAPAPKTEAAPAPAVSAPEEEYQKARSQYETMKFGLAAKDPKVLAWTQDQLDHLSSVMRVARDQRYGASGGEVAPGEGARVYTKDTLKQDRFERARQTEQYRFNPDGTVDSRLVSRDLNPNSNRYREVTYDSGWERMSKRDIAEIGTEQDLLKQGYEQSRAVGKLAEPATTPEVKEVSPEAQKAVNDAHTKIQGMETPNLTVAKNVATRLEKMGVDTREVRDAIDNYDMVKTDGPDAREEAWGEIVDAFGNVAEQHAPGGVSQAGNEVPPAAPRRWETRGDNGLIPRNYNATAEVDAEGKPKTYGQLAAEQSKPTLDALAYSEHEVGGKPLASTSGDVHNEILDRLQLYKPDMTAWMDTSAKVTDLAKQAVEAAGYGNEDLRKLEFGGVVLSREKFNDPADSRVKLWRTEASYNIGPDSANITNDPLSFIQQGDAIAKDIEANKAELAQYFPNGYNAIDIQAAHAAVTMFHELTHNLVLGHGVNFHMVLENIKEAGGGEYFQQAVDAYRQLYQKWADNGTLNDFRGVAQNAEAIDFRQPAPGSERQQLAANDVNVNGGRDNGPASTGTEGDSGVRRPATEVGQGLEAGVRNGGQNPAEVGGTANEPAGAGATGRAASAADAGATERPAGRVVRTGQLDTAERPATTTEPSNSRVSNAGTSRTVKRPARPEPVDLKNNPAYDVIEKNWRISMDKATVRDGGPGVAFLKAGEAASDKSKSFVPKLSSMDEIVKQNFNDSLLHKAGIKAGKDGGWKKFIAHVVGGKAATAGEDYEKAVVGYHILRSEGDSRKFIAMNNLHQAKAPFEEIITKDGMKSGLVHIERASDGEKIVADLGDVFSNPSKYNLTDGQKAYIAVTHRIIDDLVNEMRAQGVDIKELGVEKRGEHYFPRFVKGQAGYEFDTPYAKSSIGGKQIFEKPRAYGSQVEGREKGVVYAHPLEALEGFIDAANKTIAAKEFVNATKKYSVSGRDLALEKVGYREKVTYDKKTGERKVTRVFEPLKAASDEAKRAIKARKQAARELASARRGKSDTKIRAERRVPLAELNKQVNELDSVKKLRDRIENAKTDRTKNKLGDQLKKLVASERGKLRRGAINEDAKVVDRQGRIDAAKAKLETAKTAESEAKLKLRQVSSDMSSIVKRYSTTRVADTALLPQETVDALGLAGDIRVKSIGGNLPAFNGRLFPEKVADAINEGINDKGFNNAFEIARTANDFARLAQTSTDLGHMMIQGLPVLFRHPVAWAKSVSVALQAIAHPETYARWLDSKRDVINEMYPYAGGFTGSEYFTASRGNKVKQLADTVTTSKNPSTFVKAGVGKGLQRVAVGFESFLDAAKVNMWEGMAPHLKTTEDRVAYGRLLRNITGTTDTARLAMGKGQREIEGILAFSPRFTRSVFALAAQAMEHGPMQHEAILSIATLLGGAALAYAGVKMALGQQVTADDFNPAQGGKFMSVKIGDNWYGFGGSARGTLQLLGYSIASLKNPKRFLSTDSTSVNNSNPFLKYARTRLSPVASQIADLAAGSSIIGQDTTDRAAWAQRLPDQFLPFGVQTLVETEGGTNQKMAALGANLTGLRTFPGTPNETLDQTVRDVVGKTDKSVSGWKDLTSYQKVQLLQQHPELLKQVDAATKNNWTAYKQAAQDAAKAKAALAAGWVKTQTEHGGQKVVATDVTSKDYRDALDNINQRLMGARNALGGSDVATGLGGGGFTPNANTPRQKLMNAYYTAVDKNQYINPDGTVDWATKDALEAQFMTNIGQVASQLGMTPDEATKIVQQETSGVSSDPLENRLKQARALFVPYWNLRDSIAQNLGYQDALAIQNAPAGVQKRYNTALSNAQDSWRKNNPQADQLLKLWGYTSVTEQEKQANANKGGMLKAPRFSSGLSGLSAPKFKY